MIYLCGMKNDTLQTPPWVYTQLGPIYLDPCAGDQNFADVNYRENGLELPWMNFVFCNPPFSQKELWIKKMIEHGNGILLLPERGSAPWFGPLAQACTAYFVMGKKINFIGGSSSNNVGTALFLFGDDAVNRIRKSNLPGHLCRVEYFRSR